MTQRDISEALTSTAKKIARSKLQARKLQAEAVKSIQAKVLHLPSSSAAYMWFIWEFFPLLRKEKKRKMWPSCTAQLGVHFPLFIQWPGSSISVCSAHRGEREEDGWGTSWDPACFHERVTPKQSQKLTEWSDPQLRKDLLILGDTSATDLHNRW